MKPRWAKTKYHVPTGGLNPGRWYPVVSEDRVTGNITIRDGDEEIETHGSMVDIRDDVPTRAEISLATTFGPRGPEGRFPEAQYRATCPKGHDLGLVQPTIRDIYCNECSQRYEAATTGH